MKWMQGAKGNCRLLTAVCRLFLHLLTQFVSMTRMEDEALDKLLQSVHRVLEPGGCFIFSDNFIHGINLNITHQKCRTLEGYELALKKNGFEITGRAANYVLFNDPVDAKGKFYPRIWSLITRFSKKWKWFDAIVWPLLYPVEILLTSVIKESPAQEIMICKALK